MPAAATAAEPRYEVGIGVRSISQDADGSWHGDPVNLGGYGFGGPPLFPGKKATGVLGRGPDVRAIVIKRGDGILALASAQVQGWFVALRGQPHGIQDVRLEVERRSEGAIPAESVIVQSNHTHAGADLMGVWGGVPHDYQRYVFEQTVEAIMAAWENRHPAKLRYGSAAGRDLLSNQFGYDPANRSLDSDLRVLQALDPRTGNPIATMLNFSAHATVLPGANYAASGDWPQRATQMLEHRYGGRAIVVVGTLGRTQPSDRGCPDDERVGNAESLCALNEYAGRVVDRAARALRSARAVRARPGVEARSYLITDVGAAPVLLGAEYAGGIFGAQLTRSPEPPWFAANVFSTITGSARVGDLLISTYPGEAYPQIPLGIDQAIAGEGVRDQMTVGLAYDQLGYLIAPLGAFVEPIRRTLFNERGDELSFVDNDNYFFNVSPTIGERVRCSSLRGAGEVFGRGRRYLNADPSCLPYTLDASRPHGADLDESR